MSHVIHAELDHQSAPNDAADRVETWAAGFREILSENRTEYRTRTDILDEPVCDEFRYRFDIRDDVDAIVDDLVRRLDGDVDWLRVETHQDDREWREDAFRDDPEYYPPDWTDGHRTPLALDRAGLFQVDAGEAHYLVDGAEHAATGTTFVPDPPADGTRTDVIVAGTDGAMVRLEATTPSEIPTDAVLVGELEVHPGKTVVISEEEVDVATTDPTVAHESGNVPEDV